MEKITDAIIAHVGDEKKISCAAALKIANDFKVSPAEIGKELNRLNIKINGCQLGCFQ
jgi:hypothetical protein